jgi:dimeric dUTPase (all-alpha-NTP-PPase superfamily)
MKLEELFKMQEKLDNEIMNNHFITEVKPKDLLNERLLALHTEVSELANATRSFKYWSTKESESKEVILSEYVDILHFWLSVGLALEVSPEEVVEAYKSKHKENYIRQKTGY